MKIIKMAIEGVFDAWIDILDLAINSDQYIIIPKNKIVCRDCGKVQTIKQSNKYVSFLCACGCRLYYPPNKEGLIVTKFISKKDYEAGKRGGK